MGQRKIIFIASYPKSGNTFMRAVISSLVYSEDGIFNYELLKKISLIDTNPFYDFVKKINIEDFQCLNKVDTSCKYWKLAQKNFTNLTHNFIFKTHAANLMMQNNNYTSEENCLGVIYLVRDPRSIVPSYAYHYNISHEKALQNILNKNNIIYNPQKNICVPLSNWDVHIRSWQKTNIPIIFVRFEDMVSDTMNTIYKCKEFLESLNLKFTHSSEKLENIYKSTKFNELKRLEKNSNFKLGKDKNFFRTGSINNNEINEEIKNRLIDFFEESMKNFNYI